MLGAVLLGTALLSAICAALLLASAWAAGFLSRGATANELAADIALCALAIAIALTSALLVAEAATPLSVSATFLTLGALAVAFDGRSSLARLAMVANAGLRVLRSSRYAWLVPAFALCAIARGLSLPQLSWDGLTYHLTYPASWIQAGGVTRFEAGGVFELYETFPKGGETLFYLAMLPFHGDALVNLANLPGWFALVLSLRACAQRLGVRRSLQDGCAASVALCPAFAAYVTPAYVEVTSAVAFSAAISASLRALGGEPRALVLLGVALGVAIATKLTGLHLLALGVLVVLLCARRDPPAAWRGGFGALASCALVASPFYLRNALVCQNPLYPAPLPGFGSGPRAGSLPLRFMLEQSSVLSQGALGRVVENLCAPPWTGYPLGPALGYPLALLVPWLGLCFGARARRPTIASLYALALCELCVYLVSPWNGIYTGANTRFLGPSLIAAALAGVVALETTPTLVRASVGVLAFSCSLAYLARAPVVAQPVPCVAAWLAAIALGASLACSVAAATSTPERLRSYVALAALAGACALAALPSALFWREQHRLRSYAYATDLHPLPSASKPIWALVAGLPASRIAFAVAGIDSTEGWFFYPLFGADLRHIVRYVDVQADGELASCVRRGRTRDRPDYAAWRQRLRAQHVDYLATHGAPLEEKWAETHPDSFARIATVPGAKLFRVKPDKADAQAASAR